MEIGDLIGVIPTHEPVWGLSLLTTVLISAPLAVFVGAIFDIRNPKTDLSLRSYITAFGLVGTVISLLTISLSAALAEKDTNHSLTFEAGYMVSALDLDEGKAWLRKDGYLLEVDLVKEGNNTRLILVDKTELDR